MMGKIIGIALVGLTQFLLWIVLTGIFLLIFQFGFMGDGGIDLLNQQNQLMQQSGEAGMDKFMLITEVLDGTNFTVMIFGFLFYFLGGYLLYASLFAAIGGAVDQDADTQQFMMPVSIPLIFSIAMSGVIINQPDGALSVWLSMIPFTSPIIMMMRIPFGVPLWQLWTSMALLILGFIGSTWIAGKIYRTGILMYGKKVGYLEIWKWIRG